jgi:hypothetical protein
MKISDITANIVSHCQGRVVKMAAVISENFMPVHSLIPNVDSTQTETDNIK